MKMFANFENGKVGESVKKGHFRIPCYSIILTLAFSSCVSRLIYLFSILSEDMDIKAQFPFHDYLKTKIRVCAACQMWKVYALYNALTMANCVKRGPHIHDIP